jgi:hypothetical protein
MVMSSKQNPGMWKTSHENDGKAKYGGRDVVGYGMTPPHPNWPKKAKVRD